MEIPATFDALREDDRVRHTGIGLGTVEQVTEEAITVLFDDLTTRGREQRGIYPPHWFRVHPNRMLRIVP